MSADLPSNETRMKHTRVGSSEGMTFDGEVDLLRTELDQEKTFRESAAWQNAEIEKSIVKIQEELRKEDYPTSYDDVIVKEKERNQQLAEGNHLLKEQIPELKDKLKSAKMCGADCKLKHDDLNIDLDILTQAELLKTLKRLERSKTDLKSTLRSREWSLDSESKNYQRVLDHRASLQNELYHLQNNLIKAKTQLALNRWENGGIKKSCRVVELKRGPIKKNAATEKLPALFRK